MILILALVGAYLIFESIKSRSNYIPALPSGNNNTSTSTPQVTETPEVLSYGKVVAKIGQSLNFPGLKITPLSIAEDSRCPQDVQCIQAGTVRVVISVVSGMGTSTNTLSLGKFVTTEAEKITFLSATPERMTTTAPKPNEYVLTFEVIKSSTQTGTPNTPVVSKPCFVGGCSAQICSDQQGMASTCEYREEYACYKTAKCERQASGQCGWTPTNELKMCLAKTGPQPI